MRGKINSLTNMCDSVIVMLLTTVEITRDPWKFFLPSSAQSRVSYSRLPKATALLESWKSLTWTSQECILFHCHPDLPVRSLSTEHSANLWDAQLITGLQKGLVPVLTTRFWVCFTVCLCSPCFISLPVKIWETVLKPW